MTADTFLATTTVPEREQTGRSLLERLALELEHSPLWAGWSEQDERLACCVDLAEAVQMWEHRDSRSYGIVAALTGLAARRGVDDDDAALAVLVLMAEGLGGVMRSTRDLGPSGDVIGAAWEVVKAAEPTPGPRAAAFILHRTHQRVVRAALRDAATLEIPMSEDLFQLIEAPRREPVIEVESPLNDVVDLLQWAREEGVIEPAEVELLVELMAADGFGLARHQALSSAGARRGVSARTISRCEVAAQKKLRAAIPAYPHHR